MIKTEDDLREEFNKYYNTTKDPMYGDCDTEYIRWLEYELLSFINGDNYD